MTDPGKTAVGKYVLQASDSSLVDETSKPFAKLILWASILIAELRLR